MWRRSRKAERHLAGARGGRRGFTLIEALVSLILIVLILTYTMAFLFSMRGFAEKQQGILVPRQTARRGVEYLTYHLGGAADVNLFGSPNSLVMNYTLGVTGSITSTKQTTYNNVTNAAFADVGTDVISLGYPNNPVRIPVTLWPGNVDTEQFVSFRFTSGCGGGGGDTANLALFKQLTGASAGGKSPLLVVYDAIGRWTYIQIADYGTGTGIYPAPGSNCAATDDRFITVQILAGNTEQINAPGPTGRASDLCGKANSPCAVTDDVWLGAGVQFTSFRVKNGALQQKIDSFDVGGNYVPGLFNPDAPDTGFNTVLENVDDLQIAYLMNDGSVWNTLDTATGLPKQLTSTSGAPKQEFPPVTCGPDADDYDVTCVNALRVTVVGRSLPIRIDARSLTEKTKKFRPRAEDHAAGAVDTFPTLYERFRLTSTLLLRNRLLGG